MDRATHLEDGFIYFMKKEKSLIKKGASVKDMILVIDEAIKETESKDIDVFKTAGHMLESVVSYHEVRSQPTKRGLIKMYAYVLNEETLYKAAAKDMKIKKEHIPELLLCGHTASTWKEDILARYNNLVNYEALEKLENAREELEKNLTKEDRLQESLNEVASILSTDA